MALERYVNLILTYGFLHYCFPSYKLQPSIVISIKLIQAVIAGVLAVAAQLLRFGALSYVPVVLVAPVLASQPVFTLFMSHKLAKDFEIFKIRTITAISVVTIGSVFLSIFSGITT